jgi:hypothetical protein
VTAESTPPLSPTATVAFFIIPPLIPEKRLLTAVLKSSDLLDQLLIK